MLRPHLCDPIFHISYLLYPLDIKETADAAFRKLQIDGCDVYLIFLQRHTLPANKISNSELPASVVHDSIGCHH
jgi:hypothetical protein